MSKIQVNEIVNHFDNGAPDCPRGLTVTGVSTFSGNVSIGGTLSYEDVTNIDSVGIITAQGGIHVTGGSVGIGTTNPLNGLDLNQSEGRFRVNRFSHLLMQNKNDSTTNYWGISVRNDGELDFGYGIPDVNNLIGGDKLTITSGGQVLINQTSVGTKSASAPLQLISSSTGAFGLNISMRSNNDYGFISYTDHDADEDLVQLGVQRTAANTGDLIFYTNGGNASATEELRLLSGGGIAFNGDTATANALDDYEEGTITDWRLAKTGSTDGSNNSTTEIQYTKIGRCVYISGYIYTANTGSASGAAVAIVKTSDNTTKATLPFVPNHNGALPVFHTRSMAGAETTYGLSVGFVANSAGVYLYSNDSTGDYVIDENNITTNSQTHLVLTFGGHYFTDS